MTRRAIANVAVDWQVEAAAGADPAQVADVVAGTATVTATEAVEFATTTGFARHDRRQHPDHRARAGRRHQPTRYLSTFPDQVRDPGRGDRRGPARPADRRQPARRARRHGHDRRDRARPPSTSRSPASSTCPQADSLFQTVGAPAGSAPQAPPDNVLLLPADPWHDALRSPRRGPARSGPPPDPRPRRPPPRRRPGRRLPRRSRPGAQPRGHAWPARPRRRQPRPPRSMRPAPTPSTPRCCSCSSALPGAVLAGLLTVAVAACRRRPQRRREQALLRARGATTAPARAARGRRGRRRRRRRHGRRPRRGRWSSAPCAFGTSGVRRDDRGRRGCGRASRPPPGSSSPPSPCIVPGVARRPRAHRRHDRAGASGRASRPRAGCAAGLDLMLLAGAAVVFWLTGRSGYQLVLAPEGVPTISVSYWAFAGPALLWIGCGLLRLAARRPRRSRRGRRPLPRPAPVRRVAGRHHRRQPAPPTPPRSRAASCSSPSPSAFAASTADLQRHLPPTGRGRRRAHQRRRRHRHRVARRRRRPGLRRDRRASPTPASATSSRSSTASPTSAPTCRTSTASTRRPSSAAGACRTPTSRRHGQRNSWPRWPPAPDAMLVCAETVHDFQLRPGDLLSLRLQDGRTKQYTYRAVPLRRHRQGVPDRAQRQLPRRQRRLRRRADRQRRRRHLPRRHRRPRPARRSPTALREPARHRPPPSPTWRPAGGLVGSSLTAVDLAGLTQRRARLRPRPRRRRHRARPLARLAERRRTFAIAAALGADPRQLGGFIWTEAVFVTVAGLAAGALGGWALTRCSSRSSPACSTRRHPRCRSRGHTSPPSASSPP